MKTIDLKLDNEFTFSLVYDVYPEITLGEYKDLEVEVPAVTVGKKEITAELEKIQEQNAMVMDKADGVVAKDDVITINTVEIDDEGEEVEGTGRQDFRLHRGYRSEHLQDGRGPDRLQKRRNSKPSPRSTLKTAKPPNSLGRPSRSRSPSLRSRRKKLPEINDELAQDVNDDFETLADLEKDIKKETHRNPRQ
jgi:trigger factor